MFKGLIIGILATAIVAFPIGVYGQEFRIPIDIPSNLEEVVGISVGDEAPFDGILIPTETAVFIFTGIETKIKELESRVNFTDQICDAACKFKYDILVSQMEQQKEEYEVKLASERERSNNYEKMIIESKPSVQWYWVLTGGILTGLAIASTTFFLIEVYR